ncbi:MAG: intradiol ring-cleavage dioxygenase [bacterium]|jgi:protocatechuate 3,4-dioxygenase beta subunit|nr:protocatechuate 3,4-dioxygenase [Betaproteobacteria bacterium]
MARREAPLIEAAVGRLHGVASPASGPRRQWLGRFGALTLQGGLLVPAALGGIGGLASLAQPGSARAADAPAGRATPSQSEGPFFPRELPLDRDSDLTRVAGQSAVARGDLTDLTGTVTDSTGRLQAGLLVEIWQVNAFGRYHHPRDNRGDRPLDPGFQGYGQATTDAAGRYRFRTIRPVPYPGRAPHIHVALSAGGTRRLTTQLYVAGAIENERDGLLNAIRDTALRNALLVPFAKPSGATDANAVLEARFDIVLAQDGRFSLSGPARRA